MWKEFVWFDVFTPTVNFDNFVKSLGYVNPNYMSALFGITEMNFNKDILSYIKNHNEFDGIHYVGIKGKPISKGIIPTGYSGKAIILSVNVDRPWEIKYTEEGFPYITYPQWVTDEFNRIISLDKLIESRRILW